MAKVGRDITPRNENSCTTVIKINVIIRILRLIGFRLFVMHLVMTVQINSILSYYAAILKYAHRTPK